MAMYSKNNPKLWLSISNKNGMAFHLFTNMDMIHNDELLVNGFVSNFSRQ
jgi:hypothetical protein